MGYGRYDHEAHLSLTQARTGKAAAEVFVAQACDPALSPWQVVRQSRDSADHPDSVPIIIALDVSGSMGVIPHELATETLPTFMKIVMTVLPDPQVLFIAFGNVFGDRSPLQVGQFESSAELIDKWLALAHLEGGGGGLGESYDLAMYFAARHTATDAWEKRQRKGYFFMTGDEVPFVWVAPHTVANTMGDTLAANIPIHEMAAELQTRYHTFFLIPDAARAAQFECGVVWRKLLHERAIVLGAPSDTALVAALCVGIEERRLVTVDDVARFAHDTLGLDGELHARVVGAVTPFAEALQRGPIAAPLPLGIGKDPGLKG